MLAMTVVIAVLIVVTMLAIVRHVTAENSIVER
jgi:hypothetical protein